jgi:hypothetical protein
MNRKHTSPVKEETLVSAEELAAQTRFLSHVDLHIAESIRFADSKAGFAVALCTALIGAMFAAKCHLHFVHVPLRHWTIFSILSLTAFALLLASIVAAVVAIRPRLWNSPQSLIAWQNIARCEDCDAFVHGVLRQRSEDMGMQLAKHIHSGATICTKKYRWVNASISLGTIGGLLGAIVIAWQ